MKYVRMSRPEAVMLGACLMFAGFGLGMRAQYELERADTRWGDTVGVADSTIGSYDGPVGITERTERKP